MAQLNDVEQKVPKFWKEPYPEASLLGPCADKNVKRAGTVNNNTSFILVRANGGFGKVNRFVSLFNRQNVVKEPPLAASDSKASPLLSTVFQNHGRGDSGSKFLKTLALLGAGAPGLMSFAMIPYASDEVAHVLECPSYPWPHILCV